MSLILLESLGAIITSSLPSVTTGAQGTACSGTMATVVANKDTYLRDALELVEFYHLNVLNGSYPWSNPFVFRNGESAPNLQGILELIKSWEFWW